MTGFAENEKGLPTGFPDIGNNGNYQGGSKVGWHKYIDLFNNEVWMSDVQRTTGYKHNI